METKKAKTKVAAAVLALSALCIFSLSAVGGNLNPSAPPRPTMKTLDEVEPRVPIHASDLPLTITEPNSYYLAENIHFKSIVPAITINVNDVTIDLQGFSLIGAGKVTGHGIYAASGIDNVSLSNGTIQNFDGSGVCLDGSSHQLDHIRSFGNKSYGLRVGSYSNVSNCTCGGNGSTGLDTGDRCSITRCTSNNNGWNGFDVGTGSCMSNCTAAVNDNMGIYIGRSSITNCAAMFNKATGILAYNSSIANCTSNHNNGHGFSAGSSTMTNCTSETNDGDGIRAVTMATITKCTITNNDGNGIYVEYNGRIEGNNLRYNKGYGIRLRYNSSYAIKNVAGGNTLDEFSSGGTNYMPTTGDNANYEF